jgi:hypothetical protein
LAAAVERKRGGAYSGIISLDAAQYLERNPLEAGSVGKHDRLTIIKRPDGHLRVSIEKNGSPGKKICAEN